MNAALTFRAMMPEHLLLLGIVLLLAIDIIGKYSRAALLVSVGTVAAAAGVAAATAAVATVVAAMAAATAATAVAMAAAATVATAAATAAVATLSTAAAISREATAPAVWAWGMGPITTAPRPAERQPPPGRSTMARRCSSSICRRRRS